MTGILNRFEPLNPYDPELLTGSPWGEKHESLGRRVTCYAISAKRYVLYLTDEHDRLRLLEVIDQPDDDTRADDIPDSGELTDWSEHGLGLYLDPTATDPDESHRDLAGRRLWTREAWQWLLDDAHGTIPKTPDWFDRFAVTRFSLSRPRTAAWFDGYNTERSRREHIRPGSFGLLAHPQPGFEHPTSGALPAAPYEPNPDKWPSLTWYDRSTGKPVRVEVLQESTEEFTLDSTPVQTIGQVIRRYRLRPENKSRGPDGHPASRRSAGLLQRRPIESTLDLQALTGKEGNHLLERLTGEITDPTDYQTDYGERGDRLQLTVRAVRALGPAPVAKRAGLDRRTLQRVVRTNRPSVSHRRNQVKIAQAAAAEATERLQATGQAPANGTLAVLEQYLRSLNAPSRSR